MKTPNPLLTTAERIARSWGGGADAVNVSRTLSEHGIGDGEFDELAATWLPCLIALAEARADGEGDARWRIGHSALVVGLILGLERGR